MEEIIKKLDEALEVRKQQNFSMIDKKFYVFKEAGEKFYGKILDFIEDNFGRTRVVALNIKDNEEYVLPGHKALVSQVQELNGKPGDYIVVEYLGKSERGVNRYVVAIIKQNTNEKKKEEKEEEEEVLEDDFSELDKDVEEILEEDNKDEKEEAKKAIKSFLEFYDEVPLSEVEYYIKEVKRLNVDVKEIIQELGYEIRDDKVVKSS